MARELNISLIIGIIVGNLPIWQWDTRTGCVIGIFTIAGIVCGIILWLEDKKTKKKNPTAATVKVQ